MTTIEAALASDADPAESVADLLRKIGADAANASKGVADLDRKLEQVSTEVQRINGGLAEVKAQAQSHEQTLHGRAGRHGLVSDVEDLKGRPPPGMVTTRALIAAVVGVAVVFGSVAAVVGLS